MSQKNAGLENLSLSELSVRDMRSDDLTQVLHIEQTAHVSPWGRLSFEESLTRNEQSQNNAHPCRVIEARGEIVAYHVVSVILDELHILNVVCAPKAQGLGLGHRLMTDILELADSQNLDKIFLEVRISNTIAQSLYEKWGFKQIAVRKRYYRPAAPDQPREDALVYLRDLG